MHYIEIPKPQHSFFLCFTNYELQCIRFFKNVPLPRGRFGECSVRELLTIFRAPTVHCESSAAAAAAVARRPPHHHAVRPSVARPSPVRRRRPRRPRPPCASIRFRGSRQGISRELSTISMGNSVLEVPRCPPHPSAVVRRRRIVTVPPS